MHNTLTRRTLMTSTAAGAVALAATGALAAPCPLDHTTAAYRLGATLVDPALDPSTRERLEANAACPHCGGKIEAQGLSYDTHMPA